MKVNIADAACGLILVMLLTPKFGISGYIFIIWVCEIGNLAASLHRLSKITKVSITDALRQYVKPLIIFIIMTINKNIFMKGLNPVLSMIIFTGLYV